MKRFLFPFALLLSSLFFFSCEDSNEALPYVPKMELYGVEFRPNYFYQDGVIVGMDADIASLAIESAGYEVKKYLNNDWEKIYNTVQQGGNKALLTMAYSPERADLFKWAGPTTKGFYCIVTKEKAGYNWIMTAEDAKEIPSVGVVKGWLETTSLEELGFENLKYYDTYELALQAFIADEVVGFATDFLPFRYSVSDEYYENNGIRITYRYKSVAYYIAFSKDVDDRVVETCQQAINDMINDGTTYQIGNRYFNNLYYSVMPGTLQLYSEKAPPMNYSVNIGGNKWGVAGSSAEIVSAIQKVINDNNITTVTSWEDAYDIVSYLPNSALFTTARTSERENNFKWVGPIASLNAKFFTLKNNNIEINTIDDAKKLDKILTPKGWYTHDILKSNSFGNIVATTDNVEEIFRMFIDGEADALLIYDTAIKWLCEENEYDYTNIKEHISVQSDKGYIAFSKTTADSIVNKWQNALIEIKNNGEFETIWNKYYPGIAMP